MKNIPSKRRPPAGRTPGELIKRQRLVLAAAIIVGNLLVFFGHAPVLPVIVGCVAAVAISMWRSWKRMQ